MLKLFVLAVTAGLLSGCENTFFGDNEGNFPSPFDDGQVTVLEPVELANLEDATASQRHPGIMYATESVSGTTQIVAFDEDGSGQGGFGLEDVQREGWLDLAVRDQQILLLRAVSGVGYVHRYDEPRNPSPFSGTQPLLDTLAFTLPDADVSSCLALGAAKSQNANDVWLLCGNRFYRLAPAFGEESPQVAIAEDRLDLLLDIGEIRDFSISPGGQYGLLVGSEMALVTQADDEQNPAWGAGLSNKPETVKWDGTFSPPVAGTFAFNTVLLYLFAPVQPQGQLLAIFTP